MMDLRTTALSVTGMAGPVAIVAGLFVSCPVGLVLAVVVLLAGTVGPLVLILYPRYAAAAVEELHRQVTALEAEPLPENLTLVNARDCFLGSASRNLESAKSLLEKRQWRQAVDCANRGKLNITDYRRTEGSCTKSA